MSDVIKVRGIEFGTQIPRTGYRIMEHTQEGICESARRAMELEQKPDLIEWRADCFEQIDSLRQIFTVIETLRRTIGETPLLFTLRTSLEGGNVEFSPVTYTALNKFVALNSFGMVDMIDLQLYRAELEYMIDAARQHSIKVILSNTTLSKTPRSTLLFNRARNMRGKGADLVRFVTRVRGAGDLENLQTLSGKLEESIACPYLLEDLAASRKVEQNTAGPTSTGQELNRTEVHNKEAQSAKLPTAVRFVIP